MKKLSTKIVLALVIVFIFISAGTRLFIFLSNYSPAHETNNFSGAFVFVVITGFLSLALFAGSVNFIIVKRIQKLNKAVKEIEKGRYDVAIEVEGNDEIGTLMKNINLMAEELRSNEYLSKEFSKNVSHEFKTPLSSIKGYADLIKKGDLSQEETAEYARIIINEIDRLSKLSKSILQMSLLDSANLMPKYEIFQIDEQIRSTLQLMQLEWELKNIEFELDLEEIKYRGKRELTDQIWQNLISNAIKFSEQDGIIRIRLHKENGIHFEIEDNGIGIKEEDKEKIFNQFFIADKSRNKAGSGLGLSITKKTVEKLGGEIKFESKASIGTTFYVWLPIENDGI